MGGGTTCVMHRAAAGSFVGRILRVPYSHGRVADMGRPFGVRAGGSKRDRHGSSHTLSQAALSLSGNPVLQAAEKCDLAGIAVSLVDNFQGETPLNRSG